MATKRKGILIRPITDGNSIRDHIRKKPGMYLGRTGRTGILPVIYSLLDTVLCFGPQDYRGRVDCIIKELGLRQRFTVRFHDLASSALPMNTPEVWFERLTASRAWELVALIATTRRHRVESSDGKNISTNEGTDGLARFAHIRPSRGKPFFYLCFELEPAIWDKAGVEEFYQISGALRTVATLRGGLTTVFKAQGLEEIRCFYREGLKSRVMEMDHQRFPQHAGCLSFQVVKDDMKVEGHLRFLHAGPATILNFANYYPTQGGAHVEGLGLALRELFGKEARGCRDVLLMANPDTGRKYRLPHSCIGALHAILREPKYSGPTKDILYGEDVKKFVYQAAKAQLRSQWDRFKAS